MFQRSLELVKETGYLKQRKIKLILGTNNIMGRGAVKDTYNLLADGIRELMHHLIKSRQQSYKGWVVEKGFDRYLTKSIKGDTEVNWDEENAWNKFLKGIFLDADQLLIQAEETNKPGSEKRPLGSIYFVETINRPGYRTIWGNILVNKRSRQRQGNLSSRTRNAAWT